LVCRKAIQSEASTPRPLAADLSSKRAPTPPAKTPLVIPSIVSESDIEPPVSPAAVPLPPSEFNRTLSSGSREVEPEPLALTKVTHTDILSLLVIHPSRFRPLFPGESLRTWSVSLTAPLRTRPHSVYSPFPMGAGNGWSYYSTCLHSLHEDRDESYETSAMHPCQPARGSYTRLRDHLYVHAFVTIAAIAAFAAPSSCAYPAPRQRSIEHPSIMIIPSASHHCVLHAFYRIFCVIGQALVHAKTMMLFPYQILMYLRNLLCCQRRVYYPTFE